jgi:hypothetical protein
MVTKKVIHPGNPRTMSQSSVLEASTLLVQKQQSRLSASYAAAPRVFAGAEAVETPRSRERLDEIKALRQLVTICAWCNKTRDSEGHWHRSWALLSRGVQCSHGICPECADRSYNAYLFGNIGVKAASQCRREQPIGESSRTRCAGVGVGA